MNDTFARELAEEQNTATRQKAERAHSRLREYRIGSRVTCGDQDDTVYTLVALRLNTMGNIDPLYFSDAYVTGDDNQFGELEEDDLEDIQPAPDDPGKASAARAWAIRNRETITRYGDEDVLFDIPATADQLRRFLDFCEADREWRVAEHAMRRAAGRRAYTVAQVAWTDGTQSSAARILGLNQSSVSRAVAASDSTAP